jgi:hypothetical protein
MREQGRAKQNRTEQDKEGKVMCYEWEHKDGKCGEIMLLDEGEFENELFIGIAYLTLRSGT